MFQLYYLNNKARVILVPQSDTRSVTVLVMYPVGSRYEPEKLSGVSHFIEHLMFKGTKKRKSTLILTREIDRLGAEYNAFTSKEYTGYYIKTDSMYTQTALDILSDMLFHSLFDQEEMEREKGPVVEEIRMYKDNPLLCIENLFESLLYNGPLGRDIAGTEKHVLGFERQAVLKYRERYYQPRYMTIVVAGRIDNNTTKCIEVNFGKIKNTTVGTTLFQPYHFRAKKKAARISVENKHTDQAQLMLGFPGLPYNSHSNPVVAVMNMILGGSMSSRLFIQIRERRGLAYMIRSGAENFRDTGYLSIRAGLDVKKTNTALSVIQREIQKIVNNGVTPRELKDAKTHIRGSLTLSLENSNAQASWYAKEAIFQTRIRTPEEELEIIEAVSNQDIKKLAEQIFDWQKLRVAIIGDINSEEIKL